MLNQIDAQGSVRLRYNELTHKWPLTTEEHAELNAVLSALMYGRGDPVKEQLIIKDTLSRSELSAPEIIEVLVAYNVLPDSPEARQLYLKVLLSEATLEDELSLVKMALFQHCSDPRVVGLYEVYKSGRVQPSHAQLLDLAYSIHKALTIFVGPERELCERLLAGDELSADERFQLDKWVSEFPERLNRLELHQRTALRLTTHTREG